MERQRTCLKCGTVKPSATFNALEECTNCGAIFARVEASKLAAGENRRPSKSSSTLIWRAIVFAALAIILAIVASEMLPEPHHPPVAAADVTTLENLGTQKTVISAPSEIAPEPELPAERPEPEPSPPTPAEDPNIEAAKKALLTIAKDPESVQFRNVKKLSGTTSVCGEYNARNGFGGYNGFKKFWVNNPLKDEPTVVTDEGEVNLASIVCDGK